MERLSITASVLVSAVLLLLSIQAAFATDVGALVAGADCRFQNSMVEVGTYADVPSSIREKLGEMAERGAPWQSTDVVTSEHLPFARLIRAGHRRAMWFVWYERGGIGYWWEVALSEVGRQGAGPTMRIRIGINWREDHREPMTEVCSLIEGIMDGKFPPYPAGVQGVP